MGDNTTTSKGNILLNVEQADYKSSAIEVEFKITNSGEEDIWLCVSNDRDRYPNYESRVSPKGGHLQVFLKSFVVPDDILLEEPIFARYRRIPAGESRNFEVRIKLPAHNMSPIASEKTEKLELDQLDIVTVEIGYYSGSLEAEKGCCMETDDPDELLVNCFWAAENKEESITSQMTR